MTATAAELKSCCAAAYSSEAVLWLLGESLHPGGLELTERLAAALRVGAGDLVVDVGSGVGASAVTIARVTGCAVLGVDISVTNVERARARAAAHGLDGRIRFLQGEAEALPLVDGSADGAVSECSLCLVPDKAAAARELARVLRPGGRLAVSDVTAVPGELPPELQTPAAWAACLADARPLAELAALLEDAGLAVERVEEHDDLLAALADRVAGRLRLASLLDAGLPDELRAAVSRGLELSAVARQALDHGLLGYGVVYASRPSG